MSLKTFFEKNPDIQKITLSYLSWPENSPMWRRVFDNIMSKNPFLLDDKSREDIETSFRFFTNKIFETEKFLQLLYDVEFSAEYFIIVLLDDAYFDKLVCRFNGVSDPDQRQKILSTVKKPAVFFMRHPQYLTEFIRLTQDKWQIIAPMLNIEIDGGTNDAGLLKKMANSDISIDTLITVLVENGLSEFADELWKFVNLDIKNIGFSQKYAISRNIAKNIDEKITVQMEYAEWSKYTRWRENQKRECIVCMDGPQKCVFMPCRHQMVCEKCQVLLSSCPYCKQNIDAKIIPING